MCGIAGEVKFNGPIAQSNLQAMNDALRHRGPDGQGTFTNSSQNIGLTHRRLSFLDLSDAGAQPMANADASLHITYNGEIYNYVELRSELERKGFRFRSRTDTEVILHGYAAWGSDVVNRLKGMFAFAIWNERTKELFLARDRFGIKPLYYYYERGNFVFASEIKGIKSNTDVHTSIDFSAFADYFVYRYVPSPNTIWREVKKLPAANWLLLQPNGVLLQKQYWNPAFAETKLADKDAVQYFDELFLESVKTHTRSDVPVGSFLSGGYDSSAIVHYLSRFGYVPSTFSIGFAGWKISEHLFANMVAEKYGTKHHCLIIESQSLDLLDRLAWFFDEPNGDISTIPTYLVSREASKEVKAVMSGDGGDEILVGYEWQKNFSEVAQKRTWREKLSGFLNASGIPFLLQYYAGAMAMGRFDTAQLKKMMHSDLHDSIQTDSLWHYRRLYNAKLPDLKAMQLLDVKHFLGELVLAKVDRASMANSLEVRVPFLDHEICEWVFSLSSAVYYRNDEAKHLLYQNIKNHLPAQILRRRKQGLVGPDSYYMNIEWYQKHLSESALIKDGIVNSFYVGSLIEAKDHWRLWKLSVMESWYRCWC